MFVLLPIALLTAGIGFGIGLALDVAGLARGGPDARRAPEVRRTGWVIVVVCLLGLLFTLLTANLR